VQVAEYPPGAEGAVQLTLAPVPDTVPPVTLQLKLSESCCGSAAVQANVDVFSSLTVDGLAVTEYTCGGRFAGKTARLSVLVAFCAVALLSVT
jgi:hypothetical protein